MTGNDPLLQPLSVQAPDAEEPCDVDEPRAGLSEDGVPKQRYRLYHAENGQRRHGADHDWGFQGRCVPFRIDDAVASRTLHAALYDGIQFGLRT